jgi:hypothetical protein
VCVCVCVCVEEHADWKEGSASGKAVGNADFPKENPSSSEKGDQLVCRINLSLSVGSGQWVLCFVSTRDAGPSKISG